MTVKRTCPDCGTEMVEGFVLEYGTMALAESIWHPGKPKNKNHDPVAIDNTSLDYSSAIKISVFRCSNCGLLNRYALPESGS